MSKHGAAVGSLIAIFAAGLLSACHTHDHGGGAVYRPHHRTVPAGPVETRTTRVEPHYRGYRYIRYRKDRHGRYHRHPHGSFYLARDGRYYRHSDIRYRRDRYGLFHRDRLGGYFLARDGRYYNTRDGHYSEHRRERYKDNPAAADGNSRNRLNPRRTNPPAHGVHDTQPGHRRERPDSITRANNAWGNTRSTPDERTPRRAFGNPAPATDSKPTDRYGRDKPDSRSHPNASAEHQSTRHRVMKRTKSPAKSRPPFAKKKQQTGAGRKNATHEGTEARPGEPTDGTVRDVIP